MKTKKRIRIFAITIGCVEPLTAKTPGPAQSAGRSQAAKQKPKINRRSALGKEEGLTERKDKRTIDSTTYERADGRKTVEFYAEAVRFRDSETKC